MMTNEEFAVWCLKDAASQVAKALTIYAVLLGAYWIFVG